MAFELFYTSSPRGLKPSSSGFCTVGLTQGFPEPFIARLEALSGYRSPFDGAGLAECPSALSHWIIEAAGVERHALSAVQPTKPDHTKRSNKIAHHLLLRPEELSTAGPAWLIAQGDVMAHSWIGESRYLEAEKVVPRGDLLPLQRCGTWANVGGDAGWAGVLVNAALLDVSKPCAIVYPRGAPVLQLIEEAMLLLPQEHRWRVTFTTYFMQPLAGVRCTWRFCLDGTDAAAAARASAGLTIDLCSRAPCTRVGRWIDTARSGIAVRSQVLSTLKQKDEPPLELVELNDLSSVSNRVSSPIEIGVDYVRNDSRSSESTESLYRALLWLFCSIAFLLLCSSIVLFVLWQSARTTPIEQQQNQQPASLSNVGSNATSENEEALVRTSAEVSQLQESIASARQQNKQLEKIIAQTNQELADERARFSEQSAQLRMARESVAQQAKPPKTSQPPVELRVESEPISMPTRRDAWSEVMIPELSRKPLGEWHGENFYPCGSRVPVKVDWAIGSPTGRYDLSFSKNVISVGGDLQNGMIGKFDFQSNGFTFKWVASAAVVNKHKLEIAAVKQLIQQIPFRVEFLDGSSRWFSWRTISKKTVTNVGLVIDSQLSLGDWDFSILGANWQLCGPQFTLPIQLQGKLVGEVLGEVNTGRLLLSVRMNADFDLQRLAAETEDTKDKLNQTISENQKLLKAKSPASELVASENAVKAAREKASYADAAERDAKALLEKLQGWTAMLVQTGSVPIEIGVQAPIALDKSSKGSKQ